MLDLRQLAVLRAIRDTGSIAQASRALHLSQPSVLHHLNALESHLGTPLVRRTARGSTLTPIGEMFAAEAETALRELETAERRVAEYRRHGAPTLRIGTFVTAGARVLPRAIRTLSTRTEGEITVLEGNPWDVLAALKRRRIDAALIYDLSDETVFAEPGLRLTPLWEEPFAVAVAPSMMTTIGRGGPFTALRDIAWVRSPHEEEPSARVLQRLSRRTGVPVRTLILADDYELIFALVAEGLAAAVVAGPATVRVPGVEVFELAETLPTRRVSFAVLDDQPFEHGLVAELRDLLLSFGNPHAS